MNTAIETELVQAMQHIGAGRLGEAETACTEILEKQPNNAAALHALGLTHYMARRYKDAIEHMTKAVQFDATNPQFFCNLGESLRRAQQADASVEVFEKALSLKPEYLHAHLGIASSRPIAVEYPTSKFSLSPSCGSMNSAEAGAALPPSRPPV